MNFEKTYDVPKGKSLIIELPEKFRMKKQIKVIIKDIPESRKAKIEQLQKAASDPLFLSDVRIAVSDFEHSDNEIL